MSLRNGEEVIEMYLEAWQAEGQIIPEPRTMQVTAEAEAIAQTSRLGVRAAPMSVTLWEWRQSN